MLMSETSATVTTILVIDSDADLAASYGEWFSLNGFAILKATTGQEGIQLAKLHYPQLIVCGVGLPDMDGYDMLIRVKSHPINNIPPIVILTGYGGSG